MSIDSSWNMQAVTALDLSAMSAAESIVHSSTDDQRRATVFDDFLGGKNVPVADVSELTNSARFDSEGPGVPLRVGGRPTEYETGLIRPVAATDEGSPADLLRESAGATQLDRAYASNLAAENFIDHLYLGRIVDYVA